MSSPKNERSTDQYVLLNGTDNLFHQHPNSFQINASLNSNKNDKFSFDINDHFTNILLDQHIMTASSMLLPTTSTLIVITSIMN